MSRVMIMAGGTGGHIYPALAVGAALENRGVSVSWMGSAGGMEDKLVTNAGFPFDSVRIQKLWNSSPVRWLTMPVWLSVAVIQCIGIILRRKPDALLGMGGYVCGPGGIAGYLLRLPLLIHESNAIPGFTNRVLALLATRVLTGFKDVQIAGKPYFTGTPVSQEIINAAKRKQKQQPTTDEPLRLLVIGGSQGAASLNYAVPAALAKVCEQWRPVVHHQSGMGQSEAVSQAYASNEIVAKAVDYIDDMAQAYQWADIVVARAGAMTLAEISTVGLAAILVPYPHAARNHQLANAQKITGDQSAILCTETEGFEHELAAELGQLLQDRSKIQQMAAAVRQSSPGDATSKVVEHCVELMQ